MNPTIYLIAGPNGAGKTIFAWQYLPKLANCRMFLNADLIAAGLSPFTPDKEGAKAARILLSRFRDLVQARETFALESTLAGKSYARMFVRMKDLGYWGVLFYFALPSADLAVVRVANRVRQGGHDVSEQDIRRRFQAGAANFAQIYQPLADEWWLIENGSFPPSVIGRKVDGQLLVVQPDLYRGFVPEWHHQSITPSGGSNLSGSGKVAVALELATRRAVEVARQTRTSVVTWQDGSVQAIPGDEVDGP